MWSVVITIVVSLILSAFFSGMEIAFLSSNKLKLEIDRKQNPVFNYIAGIFSRHSGQYITTLLVGNNIALVIYSMFMSRLIQLLLGFSVEEVWGHWGIIFETTISTVIVIFVAEFLPKAAVKINPNLYYRILIVPVYLVFLILYPISKISTLISIAILRITGLRINNEHQMATFDRVDLVDLLDDVENDSLADNDKDIKLFQNALDFPELAVRDCMVPRIDIEAVDIEESFEELHARFVETNFSRLPVYEGSIDNIIGYITSKSLFECRRPLREMLNTLDYVPESMPAQKLLTIFIKRRHSMAIVIDEFGGTAGLITIEDILEEIFGEIEDEHDEQSMVEKLVGEGEYVFSARLEVDYLNEKYDFEIPESDEYDTLAGYIIYNNEDIPEQGEEMHFDDLTIRILRKSSSKIELVKLKTTKKRD